MFLVVATTQRQYSTQMQDLFLRGTNWKRADVVEDTGMWLLCSTRFLKLLNSLWRLTIFVSVTNEFWIQYFQIFLSTCSLPTSLKLRSVNPLLASQALITTRLLTTTPLIQPSGPSKVAWDWSINKSQPSFYLLCISDTFVHTYIFYNEGVFIGFNDVPAFF